MKEVPESDPLISGSELIEQLCNSFDSRSGPHGPHRTNTVSSIDGTNGVKHTSFIYIINGCVTTYQSDRIHLRVPRFGADNFQISGPVCRPHTLTPVGKQGLPSLSLPAETKRSEISSLVSAGKESEGKPYLPTGVRVCGLGRLSAPKRGTLR